MFPAFIVYTKDNVAPVPSNFSSSRYISVLLQHIFATTSMRQKSKLLTYVYSKTLLTQVRVNVCNQSNIKNRADPQETFAINWDTKIDVCRTDACNLLT